MVADDQFGLAGGATPQAQGQGFVDAGALGDPGQYFPVLSFAVTPFRTVRYDRGCLLVRPCEPVFAVQRNSVFLSDNFRKVLKTAGNIFLRCTIATRQPPAG